MRVLFVTGHLPYPRVSGGRLREYELVTRLGREFELHLCAVSKTYGEDRANAARLSDVCTSTRVFAADELNGDARDLPLQVRRHRSAEASAYVSELVRAGWVDLVHVEGFYLVQHVPEPCPLPLLLVEQNVEYDLWCQRTATAPDDDARRRSFLEFRTTREHEVRAWRRSSLCGVLTEEDRLLVQRAAPDVDVRLVSGGADHLGRRRRAARPSDVPTLVFVANFGYEPNVDAVLYLCREILPAVRERVPGTRLLLVGNSPPPEVEALAGDGVVVTGRVRCVEPFLDQATVVVAPLRIGGGIKVKVLEALCRGKAIVASRIAVQGLGRGIEQCVAVADGPRVFADAVTRLLEDPFERRRLERASRAFATTLPTWDDAAASLASCYRELAFADVSSAALERS